MFYQRITNPVDRSYAKIVERVVTSLIIGVLVISSFTIPFINIK